MNNHHIKQIVSATIITITLFGICHAADFIHPLEFNGSKDQKNAVVSFIEESVKNSCASIGVNDPATHRMMEKQNLNAFKSLTQAKDRALLDMVIQQCKDIGIIDYNTINMMYNQQEQASKDKLSW